MIATHLIWTTYGTWLPGDERGWVNDREWRLQPPDARRRDAARDLMGDDGVTLTVEQQLIVERTIADHCRARGWELHALHVGAKHVHVVVSVDREPVAARDQLKAWCSRRLSDATGLIAPMAKGAGRKRWFTEGGDTEFIDDEQYLETAIRYVKECQ